MNHDKTVTAELYTKHGALPMELALPLARSSNMYSQVKLGSILAEKLQASCINSLTLSVEQE